MDSPFLVAPVSGPGAFDQIFSVEGASAAELESRLLALVAALVETEDNFVIRGFDVSGAGAGGSWLATVTALQGVTQPNLAIEVPVGVAVFKAVESIGRGNDITQSAPTTGRSLQARILQFFPLPSFESTAYGVVTAGSNEGKRFLALGLFSVEAQ